MADPGPKSYLRPETGPTAIDDGSSSSSRVKGRTNSRRHRDLQDGERHHVSKRSNSNRSVKRDPSHRRVKSSITTSTSVPEPAPAESPPFELEVINQPAKAILLGMPVDISVVVTLRSQPEQSLNDDENNLDPSALIAVTTLTTESANGEVIQLDAGALKGPKMFDSVHPMPREYLEYFSSSSSSSSQEESCRHILGYAAFPGLVIRQTGSFRIRVTLLRMDAGGATTLVAVDSEGIKVDRRVGSGEKGQFRGCD